MTFKRERLGEHGTMTRYRQHLYDGDPAAEIDQPCKDAKNEHDRQYQSTPERRAKMTRQQTVRRRALARLGDEFPQRFRELLMEEEIALTMAEIRGEKAGA